MYLYRGIRLQNQDSLHPVCYSTYLNGKSIGQNIVMAACSTAKYNDTRVYGFPTGVPYVVVVALSAALLCRAPFAYLPFQLGEFR